jgi:hypothetical protein
MTEANAPQVRHIIPALFEYGQSGVLIAVSTDNCFQQIIDVSVDDVG